MEQKLKMAAQCPPMLRDIVETTVFYDNIKGAIRCARAGKTPDFCEKCIVDPPAASKKELKNSVLKGVDGVLKLLHGVSVHNGYLAVEAYKISPSEFEKFVDNLVLSKISAAKYIAVGAEPLVAYLIAKLTEIKVCRIAVNGIATAEDQNKTREMLRELYG
jgi:V/A-type H+-transporting ATPase subunit C